MKIIFVTGAPGTGKSHYIQNHYRDTQRSYILDMALQSKKLYGNMDAISDGSKIAAIYNTLSEEALFALFDGLDLIVEYCVTGYDGDLITLVKEARTIGIHTELIAISLDSEIAQHRIQTASPDYYPSLEIKDATIEILQGVLESYGMNQDFEEICEIESDESVISFFKAVREGKECFFYNTDPKAYFDFEPEFEFEKIEGVNYLKEFDNFNEAFDSLLETNSIFDLHPLKVNIIYENKLKEYFLKQYQEGKSLTADSNLGKFLN